MHTFTFSNKNENILYQNPINFINSLDYMSEDISAIKHFESIYLNNDYDDEYNLLSFITEINNLLQDKNIHINSESDLFK